MVSLGFLSRSEQCPEHVRHVRVLPGDASLNRCGPATVVISPDPNGNTHWTFSWYVLPSPGWDNWPERMASQLTDLAWNAWWLDVASLTTALGLAADRALMLWGGRFWPGYRLNALVFLDVGSRRRLVYQAVRDWESRFAHVRFSTEHDLDEALARNGHKQPES